MNVLLAIVRATERALEWIADLTGWLFLVLMGVICFDVLSRKIGYQIPGFGSTMLQELEWHLHAVIFSWWLGFNYLLNSHPRVDTFTAHMSLRQKAVVELVGCLVFALPFTYMLLWYGIDFVLFSYKIGEASDATNGLGHRWIIKSFFYFGIVLLMAGVLCMTTRCLLFLFGPKALREQMAPRLSGAALSV
jgi:TRAP-type mannitol/chloroaromatic compound transport system permease small subunit